MQIVTKSLSFSTRGQGDLINITEQIQAEIESAELTEGQVTLFVVGSTAGITTFEYEPGLKKDMVEFYERLAPRNRSYAHHETWGDDNGSSHIRAAIQGPSLTVPFKDGSLLTGTWQQIVLAEFDTRPRNRRIVLQLIGK